LNVVAQNFVKWFHHVYWTPRGVVFDVGIATREAIHRLSTVSRPEMAGGSGEFDNGNGSLMRILPLLFYIKDKPIEERYG
jgi:ADP-ribosylglycohydrolase